MASENNQQRPYGPIPPRNLAPSPVEEEQSAVAGHQRLTGRQIGGVALACAIGAGIVLVVTQLTAHHASKQAEQTSVAAGTAGRPFVNNASSGQTADPSPAGLPMPPQHTGSSIRS